MKTHRLLICLIVFGLLAGRAWSQSPTLHVVEENGPRSQRINIVFLSEGYTTADMPDFAIHVNNAIAYLFSREPWQRYRSYCNLYRIEVASNESGTDNGAAGGQRDTYFGTGFVTPSVEQLLTIPEAGQSKACVLLNQFVPEYPVAIMLVNDTKRGGSGGAISIASAHMDSVQIVEHELGHSFAGLADEYDIDYLPYTPEESYNVTQQTDPNLIRWKSWIEGTTPVSPSTPETPAYDDLVGLFEGAMYRTTGWYRPHNHSLMMWLGRPVGAVNREKFVLSYYQKVRPVDSFTPALTLNVSTSQMLTFSVAPKVPSVGPPLSVLWRVDSVERPGSHETELKIFSGELGNGLHTVAAEVRDPTPFVRDDPTGLLVDCVIWTIDLSNQLPGTLAAWRAAFGPDIANPSGDGINNLGKYALGLEPNISASLADRPSGSVTEISPSERYLTMTISRRWVRPEIDYLVRSSENLQLWNSGPGHTVVLQDDNTILKVRDAVPAPGSLSRFLDFSVKEK